MNANRSIPFLVLVSALALSASACAGDENQMPSSTAIASTSAGPLEHTPTEAAEVPAPVAPPGLRLRDGIYQDTADGIPYARVTLADDHPILSLDGVEMPADLSAMFTHDQLTASIDFAARFLVEEFLDSILLDSSLDSGRTDDWLAVNIDKVGPEWQSFVIDALEVRTEGSALDALVQNDVADYRVIRNAPNGPRMTSLTLDQPVETWLAANGDPVWRFTGANVRHVASDATSNVYIEDGCFEVQISVHEYDGVWKMTGWENSFQYVDYPEQCVLGEKID